MVRLAVNTAGVMAALGALARVASAQHADDDYTDDDYLDDDVWAMDQKRGVSNSETGSDGSTSKGLTETQQLVLVLVAGVAIVIVIVLAIYAYTGERRGQSTLILPTAHRKRNNRWSTWVPVGALSSASRHTHLQLFQKLPHIKPIFQCLLCFGWERARAM